MSILFFSSESEYRRKYILELSKQLVIPTEIESFHTIESFNHRLHQSCDDFKVAVLFMKNESYGY